MIRPVVERIAPQLAVSAESVGRNSRDFRRFAVGVKQKKFRRFPHLGAVHGNVYRHIAYNFYTFFFGVRFQIVVLLEKFVLQKPPEIRLLFKTFDVTLRQVFPKRQFFRPKLSGHKVLRFFDRHKKRVAVKPVRFLHKLFVVGVRFKSSECFFQNFVSRIPKPFVVGFAGFVLFDFAIFQKTVFNQRFQVDKVWIPRKRRRRLVRRIAKRRLPHGQNLPCVNARCRQKIDERPCLFAHTPYAVLPRKRRYMQ